MKVQKSSGCVSTDPTDVVRDGQCCSCQYEGTEETACERRDDKTHCVHWWDGPSTNNTVSEKIGRLHAAITACRLGECRHVHPYTHCLKRIDALRDIALRQAMLYRTAIENWEIERQENTSLKAEVIKLQERVKQCEETCR